jgi:hypothetical protein
VVCVVAVIVGGTLAVAMLRRQRSSSPKVSLAGVLTMADATRASLEMEAPDGWVAAKTPFGSAQSVPDWYVCKTAHVEGTDSMCDAVLGRHFVGGFRRVDDPNSTLTVITLVGTSKDFDDGQSGTTFSVRDQDGSLIDDPSGNQRTLVWQEPSGLHVIMIATRGDQSPPLPTGDELGVIAANLQDGLRPLMAELPVEVATGDTSGSWVSGRGRWFAAVLVHGGDVCVQFGTRTSRGLIYDIRADLENACVSRRIGTVEATVRTVTDTPGHQQLRVMGTVPATAARARVLLSGGRIIEGSTASTDRGFAAFAFDIPAGWKPLRVLALDEKGNELSRGNVQIPRSLAGDFAKAPVSLTEVARGKHDGTRWSLSVSPSSGGSIAMQYLEPLTETTATVPVPNSAAPLSATFVRSFLAGATLPEAIRVHVESPDISPIDTPATSTDIGEGRGAALWILPLPDTTVERTLTITATDPNNRELAQTTLQQAPTAPATTTSTSQ